MPSLPYYRPHLDTHRSLLRHLETCRDTSLLAGCLRGSNLAPAWLEWIGCETTSPHMAYECMEQQSWEVQPMSATVEELRTGEERIIAGSPKIAVSASAVDPRALVRHFASIRDVHQRLMASFSPEEAKRLEVEERVLVAIQLVARTCMSELKQLLPHLTTLQSDAIKVKFAQLVHQALQRKQQQQQEEINVGTASTPLPSPIPSSAASALSLLLLRLDPQLPLRPFRLLLAACGRRCCPISRASLMHTPPTTCRSLREASPKRRSQVGPKSLS